MDIVESLFNENKLPENLYTRLKKHVKKNFSDCHQKVDDFVQELPMELKTAVSIEIYEKLYTKIEFLQYQDVRFISFICPLFKLRYADPEEYIYYEGDPFDGIYFVKEGDCDYVLPAF